MMTPQFIMKAGLNDYLKGFLDGQGNFVPKSGLNPPPAWDNLESHKRTAESEIECMDWANAYAEPGYSEPERGILFANWNHVSKRTLRLLEQAGYECEWSDEWSTCGNCGRAVRTSPDSYGWQPSYVLVHHCEIVCNDCMVQDDSAMREYLESLENLHRRAVNLSSIDPSKYGYHLVESGFESGLHPGQNDDPKTITAKLRDSGLKTPILFKIDDTGQFDIGFSVWTRDEESDEE